MALGYAHGAIQWLAADAVNTTYQITSCGDTPKLIRVWTLGPGSATDANSQTTNSRRSGGFATGTSDRRCVAASSVDNAGSADCSSVYRNDAIVAVVLSGATDGLLDISAWASNGFTFIVDDQVGADVTVFWEAFWGSDITVNVTGDIQEPGATGNVDYTVTGFAATDSDDQVVMLFGVDDKSASGTVETNSANFMIGFATGGASGENIVVVGSSDGGSATMDTDGYCKTGECLAIIDAAGGNPVARAQMTQFGTNNFRLNWIARNRQDRRYIFAALKGGNWRAGSLTIAGNSAGATATLSGLPFTPIGVSLFGRMTAEQSAGVSTTQDRLSIGCGTSTTARQAMGVLDEDATGNAEIDTTIQYDEVLAYPDTAGALATAHDINAMNSDGWQLIVDTAGGVASEWIGYLTFGNLPASTDMKWLGSYPDTAPGAEFRRASLLALIQAEPIRPPATPVVSGAITGTLIPAPSLLQYTDLVAPLTIVADTPALSWNPRYPDYIWRKVLPIADHPWLFTGVTSSTIFSAEVWWRGVYPDRIDPKRSLGAASQQAFALPPFQTFTDLRWESLYPDHVDRLRFTAERQLAFTTGQTGSTIPLGDLRWQAKYPDRVWRITLPTGAQSFLWLWPFPIAPATRLFAWADYPDRIHRLTLPVGLMPSFVLGSLLPIAGPREEDRIHLGTKEAFGVTSQPIFGGW